MSGSTAPRPSRTRGLQQTRNEHGVDCPFEYGLAFTCQAVSIALGDERLMLEFYDVESLERLRDVAAEGAERLRAAIQTTG